MVSHGIGRAVCTRFRKESFMKYGCYSYSLVQKSAEIQDITGRKRINSSLTR